MAANNGNGRLLGGGVALMLVALMLQNTTFADYQLYRPVLLICLGLTAAADALLAVVAWRSRLGVRVVAIILMLPTLFVIADFVRRSSSVF